MASDPPSELLRFGAVVDGELVGYVDLHGTDPDRRELGFLVGPSRRWGRGLGFRIAAMGVARGIMEEGLAEVWAETHPANAPALAILGKLGMTQTGEGDEDEYLGARAPMLQFAMRRERWLAGAAGS
jgi:RimJ/RimL family protein N-acetyltransferase